VIAGEVIVSHIFQLASAAVGAAHDPLVEHSDPAIGTDAIYVVYTSIESTLAAVRVAGNFGKVLGVPVTLIYLRTVPYVLPVDAPGGISPVETEVFLERLRAEGLDVRVNVYLCRDKHRAIAAAIKPHSLIVVGGRRRWWSREPERWRRMLEAAGHFVVSVEKSVDKERSHA
jgi:hypothetical protein